jgi:hypothetical protein
MASSALQRADTRVLCCQDFGVDRQPGQWWQHGHANVGNPFVTSRRELEMPGGVFANLWPGDDVKGQFKVVSGVPR